MDSTSSAFFGPVGAYGAPDLATFTSIHTSEEAFCELYRGERAGRFRVYKCLKPQYRGSLLHEAILKKEFEQGYSLRHANICEIYSFMEIEGLGNCIEMEWIDGVTLDEYLKRGPVPENTFRQIAVQLCDALSYIHSRAMVHRDLKPSNIMIGHDGSVVKLIDFGLADDAASTVLKSPAGTRRWVAPEVLEGKAADSRSDIYSLGAVLRVMTDGHRRCIDRCTSEDPARRYESAEKVKEALAVRRVPWPAIIIAALVLAAVLFALLYPERPATEPLPQEPKPAPDTIYVMPLPAEEPAVKQRQPQQKPSQPGKTESESIDDIFEKASGLFEENL